VLPNEISVRRETESALALSSSRHHAELRFIARFIVEYAYTCIKHRSAIAIVAFI
jgi:hypothetical protein